MLKRNLADSPFFNGLGSAQLEHLAGLFSLVSFNAGDRIFSQGDLANRVYILETGEVALRLFPEDGGCLTIAQIQPNGIFGWSAVLGRARYTSFAVCTQAARALIIKGSDLRGLLQSEPDLGRLLLGRMALAVAGRANETQAQLARLIQDEMAQTGL